MLSPQNHGSVNQANFLNFLDDDIKIESELLTADQRSNQLPKAGLVGNSSGFLPPNNGDRDI